MFVFAGVIHEKPTGGIKKRDSCKGVKHYTPGEDHVRDKNIHSRIGYIPLILNSTKPGEVERDLYKPFNLLYRTPNPPPVPIFSLTPLSPPTYIKMDTTTQSPLDRDCQLCGGHGAEFFCDMCGLPRRMSRKAYYLHVCSCDMRTDARVYHCRICSHYQSIQ
jgi:hypothetical protein